MAQQELGERLKIFWSLLRISSCIRRRIEDIGAHEKAAIRTAMYKGDPIPDFDIGYATVHRDFCPKV